MFRTGGQAIPALAANACGVGRCTTLLGSGGASVAMVEHLMAALAMLGVGSAEVDVEGGAVPALDGSALPWVQALERAGLVAAEARVVLSLPRPVRVEGADGAWAEAVPAPRASLEVTIDFANPGIGRSTLASPAGEDPARWARRLAAARTFVEADLVAGLRAAGLALGGSGDNALVFSPDGRVAAGGGLRLPSEPAAHKFVDAVGDIRLLPFDVRAAVRMHRPGHALTHALCRAVEAAVDRDGLAEAA